MRCASSRERIYFSFINLAFNFAMTVFRGAVILDLISLHLFVVVVAERFLRIR